MNTQSTYMQWAKRRPKVTYDLALSGILNLPFPELEANIEDIDLNGDNSYGYGPLIDALAGHSDIAPGRKTDPGPHFDWPRLRHDSALPPSFFPFQSNI